MEKNGILKMIIFSPNKGVQSDDIHSVNLGELHKEQSSIGNLRHHGDPDTVPGISTSTVVKIVELSVFSNMHG